MAIPQPPNFWQGVGQGLGKNSNALIGLGSGLLSQPTFAKGLAAGGQGWMQGAQTDDAWATTQKAEAQRQAQLQATVASLQKVSPQLAEAVASGGMKPTEAWNQYFTGAENGQPTANMRDFDYAQKYPKFAEFMNPPDQPAAIEEYQWYANEELKAGRAPVPYIEFAQTQKDGMTINNNMGGTDEFYKKLDTDAGAAQQQLISDGLNARSNNARLGQIEKHLANAPEGAEGALTQLIGGLGIPTQGLDDVQAAQALINQMVPGQRPPGSGTMSDADLALFKQSLPAIVNQPGGNAYIIQTTKAINEYTIKLADIATMIANRQVSPAEGRAMQASLPNPLADFNPGGGTPQGAGQQTFAVNPQTGERLMLQNGQWVPAQ